MTAVDSAQAAGRGYWTTVAVDGGGVVEIGGGREVAVGSEAALYWGAVGFIDQSET